MLKLYHNPESRSSRFIWLLEELGEPYEIVHVGIQRPGGVGAPDPGNPHPGKKVPALVHDGQLVTESAAIALYLTDAFPGAGLGPGIGDPHRAAYLTWLAFYAGEMELAFNMYRRGWIEKDPRGLLPRDYERIHARVIGNLSDAPYILGAQFSAADILVSSPYQWVREFGPPSDAIDDWLARLAARPAARRALELDAAPRRP